MSLGVYMYPAGHGGVALYTYKLANALADEGLDVTLFADDRYELGHLPARFHTAIVLSSKYEGIRENKGPLARIGGIIAAHCYNSNKFFSYVAKNKPEIVHLHSFFFYPVEWILLHRLKKTCSKTVLTIHNVIPLKFYIRALRRLELAILEDVYNSSHRVIVHTEVNKRQLLERFSIDEEKVAVIPHGEYSLTYSGNDMSKSAASQILNIERDQKVILFFGYIREIKGLHILLKAFDKMADTILDAVLVIAGSTIEGQSFHQYRAIIHQMQHRARVRCFVEYVDHQDIPNFFLPADIVVVPYVEFFGQSGVLHLAQGFGKAVIVTDVGGLPEVVQHGKTGLVVPAGDVDSLAEAMALLLKDSHLREVMGRQARLKAMENFSWRKIAKNTIQKAYS